MNFLIADVDFYAVRIVSTGQNLPVATGSFMAMNMTE